MFLSKSRSFSCVLAWWRLKFALQSVHRRVCEVDLTQHFRLRCSSLARIKVAGTFLLWEKEEKKKRPCVTFLVPALVTLRLWQRLDAAAGTLGD